VSRYMKHSMWSLGVDPIVVPNGLPENAFDPPDRAACRELRRRFWDRAVVVKMARFDPDKRWLAAVDSVAQMKRAGWRPLLIARGGDEAHGAEVLAAIQARQLTRVDRDWREPGPGGLLRALQDVRHADVVNLRSHIDWEARSVLFRGADAVLANSGHEPFGLVGLEAMAAGGLACTGCTGEDYALAGQNALVLETADPAEFVNLYWRLRTHPQEARSLRRAGRSTARRFAWSQIVNRILLPRLQLAAGMAPPSRSGHAVSP
jgi:glycosyltransferase involved in cell wall biosynthesis